MLKIKDLNVDIKKKPLLQNINLELLSGQLNIIIGPNGAGKSTLLKSIVGIIKNRSGSILLDNKNLTLSLQQERSKYIAYMSQFNQNSNLSTLDILELSRRKHSGFYLQKRDHQLISQIIKEFNLQQFLTKNIDHLSGGQRQKIFLAAAILQEPKILLLDEPSSHLDPKNQIEMLQLVKEKTKINNLITITVLHDLQNALHYADKIIMLKDKKIINFKKSLEVDESMICQLFDTKCKLFWQEGHPFLFFTHHHEHTKGQTHSHKKEKY